MRASNTRQHGAMRHWVMIRPDPAGRFTANVAGLPEVCATAATREEALDRVHDILRNLLASGQLVSIEVQPPQPILAWIGKIDTNDPEELAYLAELARDRQEDLDNTLRELDQECSSSSSTPTT